MSEHSEQGALVTEHFEQGATLTEQDHTNPVPTEEMQSMPTWNGLKLVGDNWDRNLHPSFQRQDHQTRSLHYFNSYAVRDRLNLSAASDEPKPPLTSVAPSVFLMSKDEWSRFKDDCSVLITR